MKGIGISKIIVLLIVQGTRPTDVPPVVDLKTAVRTGLFMALLICFQVNGFVHGTAYIFSGTQKVRIVCAYH